MKLHPSKYTPLWQYLKNHHQTDCQLSYAEIKEILGFDLDHSFLTYKKEAENYGYKVGKISLKNQTVIFHKI